MNKVTLPAAYDEEILMSVRALLDGKANEGQQKTAMNWIIFNVCHIGLLSFSETDRETAFLDGQRSVGLQIVKLREPEALKRLKDIKAKRDLRSKRQEATE